MPRVKGQTSMLPKDKQDKVLGLLAEGNYIATACLAAGISSRTFRSWLERAENPEYENCLTYKIFRDKVEQALAIAESDLLRELKGNPEGKWERLAWKLERRWPDHWGKKERVENTLKGDKDNPLKIIYELVKPGEQDGNGSKG